jgi:argH: argininosuccinate lyase
LLITL